jgi:alanine-alpha-ketoisovalerate/valine-pyruvate aminotransferase
MKSGKVEIVLSEKEEDYYEYVFNIFASKSSNEKVKKIFEV